MSPKRTGRAAHGPEIALAVLVVGIVGMLIIPLPTWLLDLLIAANLCLALVLLSAALFVRRALSFGALPTILLISTLFRLALNVSSTRLILAQADAGRVIAAFGDFVVAGNPVVGAVVFLVLTLIQFVVIARGSERVAEVGARFTLDAMPGKQLAIDADLRAGVVDARGASARRRALERESQFYGAMDGAMKFVKGDAVASLAITAINLIGGLVVGVLQRDMEAARALEVFGRLTIGDGLVSQLPALLVSTAAGLVVTRVASEDDRGTLGRDIAAQVFGDWRALAVAAGFAALLAAVPGLPLIPFLVLTVALAAGAAGAGRAGLRDMDEPEAVDGGAGIELAVGPGLAERLQREEESLRRALRAASRDLYDALGVQLRLGPPRGSRRLDDDAFEVLVSATPALRGTCPEDGRFLPGSPSRGPASATDPDGRWAPTDSPDAAGGLAPVDRIVHAIAAAARRSPEALSGVEETQRALDRLALESPGLVEAVVPERVTVSQLARVLRALLAEGVSVRPLREILEALSAEPLPKRHTEIVEHVRRELAGPITHAVLGDDGVLRAWSIDPEVEEALREASARGPDAALDPRLAADVLDAITHAGLEQPGPVALLTQPDVRRALRALVADEHPDLTVLSYREVHPSVTVERLGLLSPGRAGR